MYFPRILLLLLPSFVVFLATGATVSAEPPVKEAPAHDPLPQPGGQAIEGRVPRITIEYNDNRGEFAYDVYKDGEWKDMDYYGSQLQDLVRENDLARRFAVDLWEERQAGRQQRIFGHIVLWGSVLGSIAALSNESTGGTVLGVLGAIGGTIMASTGKSKSRKAYRYLFRSVNTYNAGSAPPAGVSSGPSSAPSTGSTDCHCGEGTFPPGGP